MESITNLTNLIFFLYPLCFIISAFIITYLAIPKIVKYSIKMKIFDMPDERKEHKSPIPALGGISIMAGLIPALIFLLYSYHNFESFVFVLGIFVLFITGVVDDIVLLSASKRLFIQLAISVLIVISGVKFPNLFGIFYIYEIPFFLLFLLNVIIITGIINAFNLIDGINGLAGGLGCISIFILGILLFINKNIEYSIIAFSAATSYLAFLRYNLKPTFIFMGDNGSLVLGYLIAFFSLKLLQNPTHQSPEESYTILKIVLSISSIPVFDALRVFAGRILKNRSPFSPDKSHIHHLFIKKGFSHHKSSLVLYSFHVALILLAFIFKGIRIEFVFIINILLISILISWLKIEKVNLKFKL